MKPRELGRVFGLIGAGLLILAAALTFITGVVDLFVNGNVRAGANVTGIAVEELVVGVLVVFFSILGGRTQRDYTLASGVILVVLAIAGALFLGLRGDVLAVLGILFALLGGVLLLVDRA
ncbi:MAG TPA: hypothetical protein VJS68_03705 [Thermoplasmata archaeon]|nr:hypothetical protein [Thermoplasmata archaeon]